LSDKLIATAVRFLKDRGSRPKTGVMLKKSAPSPILSILLAILLLLFSGSASLLNGQSTRQASTVERRVETMNRQAKDFERDNMGRDANVKIDAETAKRTRRIRLEIEDDLKNLQAAYNGIVTDLNSAREISSEFVAEMAAGIRKNALRLKTNLALPMADEEGEEAAPSTIPETKRRSLAALCRNIYDLITNPIFENGTGLDVKHGPRASTDLERIIVLAQNLSN